ncbi:MAG: PilZ domain-containing protein [Spirochaetales bacterium]|nr:PilZ domain-containing protein [Spirochaetales bacterium]
MSDADRRKFPRADLVFKLVYSVEDEQNVGHSRDLSGGGICFESDRHFDAGCAMRVSFTLAGLPGTIEARGRVVRSWDEKGQTLTALEFTEVDEQDMVIITDYSLMHSGEAT